jgi:hypothetical protein
VLARDAADRHSLKEWSQPLDANHLAFDGGRFKRVTDAVQPDLGHVREGGVLLVGKGGRAHLPPEISQAPSGNGTVGGLLAATKLLAVAFEQRKVTARWCVPVNVLTYLLIGWFPVPGRVANRDSAHGPGIA